MHHTLKMSGTDAILKLCIVDDSYDTYLVPIVDDTYVLNFELNTVLPLVDIQADIKILRVFGPDQLTQIT